MALTRQTPAPRRRFATAALAIGLLSAATLPSPAEARPVEGLPYLTDVQVVGPQPCDTCPPRVCSRGPLTVKVAGEIPGCVEYRGLQVHFRRGAPTPLIFADFVVDTCRVACPTFIQAFTDSVVIQEVPQMPLGVVDLWVESHVRSCPDTTQIAATGARPFPIEVFECVEVGPPPVDSLLRSFLAFRPVPQPPCAGDTLLLEMRTKGCPPCLDLQSLHFDFEGGGRFIAEMSWMPGCVEFACIPESLYVPLGQFAAGHHEVVVNAFAHVLGTSNPDSVVAFTVNVPFDVSEPPCTPVPPPCVAPILFAANGEVGCSIELAPGGEGVLPLFARTPVQLAGLQGRIDCPPPFRISGVFPPDLAGFHVSWVPEGDRGARYVVFTSDGATIPPRVSEVLKVAIVADTGAAAGTVAHMRAWVTLASDPSGRAVPVCDISNIRIAGTPLCIGNGAMACDVNEDAQSDVRDLVLMTHCPLIDPPRRNPCPDCDGSGTWAFSDVVCCAQKILRLPIPPRDSVVGEGPQLTVEEIGRDEVGIDIRVRLTGIDPLGAAMLRLRFPGERWRAIDSQIRPMLIHPNANGWYPLVDTDLPGVLQLGAIRLSPTASSELVFNLRFLPVAAPREGDELAVEGADLAASDGTAFTLASKPRIGLESPQPPVGPNIALGAARPNPFTRTTSFTVNLPQSAHVELTVHDLLGRRIATLLSEDLPAGRRDATWEAGGARDGVYFARLVVNGRVFTQRVALLRDRR